MRSLKAILTTGFLLLTGCVPSLHPIFTGDDLVFDHHLLGVWSEVDGKDTWTFQKSGAKQYRLITTDRPFAIGGKSGGRRSDRFEAHLCRLGTNVFLDIYPEDFQSSTTDFYKGHVIAAHSFLKMSIEGDVLHAAPLNHDWVENMLARHQLEIAHEVLDGGAILLTASTKELQAFVLKYAEDPEAFAPAEFHRGKGGKQ